MSSLDLGVIGNCSISGLVDARGGLVWHCLPHFDGDPVFCALVDGEERADQPGVWRFELDGLQRWEQHYRPNTAVLLTRLYAANGSAIEITDFCPRFEIRGRMFRPQQLLRRVRAIAGTPRIRVYIAPRFGYGAIAPVITQGSNHIRYVGPTRTLRLTTNAPVTYVLDRTSFLLEAPIDFILGPDETLQESVESCAHNFQEETERHWQLWVRRLALPLRWQAQVLRAAITLKLCTFEETGAIVAAMTTSIPEAAGTQRNWDYRYCWLRDAFFVVRALNSLAEVETMEHYLRYLANVVTLSDAGHLQPVFGIALEKALTETEAPQLAGYRGMGPVRIGNQAHEHFQHDVYGNVVLAAAQAFFDERLLRKPTAADWQRLQAVGEQAWRMFRQPDAGMWELRTREGLWFGWSGKLAANPDTEVQRELQDGIETVTVDLPSADYEGYYNGYANGCLWPVFHFRPDLVQYRSADYAAYRAINTRLAAALAPLLRADDVLWVHDFHLIPFAAALRALGCRQRIGFFLHVPFPARDLIMTLPNHIELLRMLGDYDLVGVQTEIHRERLDDCMAHLLGARCVAGGWTLDGKTTRCGVFPVGIDVETLQGFATSPRALRTVARLRTLLDQRLQIIGVDRLDYSKGLLRRVAAYQLLLERYPRARGRVEFLQIAPVSRGDVSAYQAFRQELELAAAHVNGRFARHDWTPLRYLNSAASRPMLAALFRGSRIGLVTPLRDGMNLVAKEYVAAQDEADPGVLVLSQFAGAARQMTAALIANPYDTEAVAAALEQARTMPLAERRERHAALLQGLKDWDARRWHRDFMAQLVGA
ncbi:MAG: hypothetical protein NVS9B10_11420 [Nevskia sp.]